MFKRIAILTLYLVLHVGAAVPATGSDPAAGPDPTAQTWVEAQRTNPRSEAGLRSLRQTPVLVCAAPDHARSGSLR